MSFFWIKSETKPMIKYGVKKNSKAFSFNACINSKFNNKWIALWDPHPEHWYPVNDKKGHLGKYSEFEGLYVLYK